MKVRENDKPSAQHSRFFKMFKQLHLEIGLKGALVEMLKFNKWLSSLLKNKEKLEEIAITTVNAECSAIIMNKVPEKREDPGKFLIPCALQELDRTSALADSGASNSFTLFYLQILELEALTPNRMTLELANRCHFSPDKYLQYFEEGIRLEGDIAFLDNLLSDDVSHNLDSEVISDHEPEQNESSITFSQGVILLHHEFAGEPLTLPARNIGKFCISKFSLSESLPMLLLVEDSMDMSNITRNQSKTTGNETDNGDQEAKKISEPEAERSCLSLLQSTYISPTPLFINSGD
ncbi:hypothetical protein Tco_0268397 [Tanacetum coccineum]